MLSLPHDLSDHLGERSELVRIGLRLLESGLTPLMLLDLEQVQPLLDERLDIPRCGILSPKLEVEILSSVDQLIEPAGRL